MALNGQERDQAFATYIFDQKKDDEWLGPIT